MAMTEVVGDVGKKLEHPGWQPYKLREQREAHGLTQEQAGEQLRKVAEQAKLKGVPAGNPQTISQHELGEVYPGPHYRRAYALLYRATDVQLGFRDPLPGEEEATFSLTPMDHKHNGGHVLAVERALMHLAPGAAGVDAIGFQQRVMDAWKRRHTGGDTNAPTLVLVGGYAGTGKTELARFLSELTGWPLLDKDPMSRALVEALLVELGSEPNDRQSDLYRSRVRPLEYECLLKAAYANIDCGISTVLTAPFIAEMVDEAWMRRLENRCAARGVKVAPVWVQCDTDSMREYIGQRSAARDTWKLQNWADYVASLDMKLRPVVPHLVVDNRYGTAVSLADRARLALGMVG
ncbi:AAA family ATPase [Kitasatospora sp. NPDC087315]|uniref:AAA family ATPase n=1 Tax=Kitasatospora sp. NPDC087315 TaxID=3364069 RepID=UPI0037F5CEBB